MTEFTGYLVYISKSCGGRGLGREAIGCGPQPCWIHRYLYWGLEQSVSREGRYMELPTGTWNAWAGERPTAYFIYLPRPEAESWQDAAIFHYLLVEEAVDLSDDEYGT